MTRKQFWFFIVIAVLFIIAIFYSPYMIHWWRGPLVEPPAVVRDAGLERAARLERARAAAEFPVFNNLELRDYFAAQAIAGKSRYGNDAEVARRAYQLADEMLLARQVDSEPPTR